MGRAILHAPPFELITIFGGALGAFVVNNQPKVLKATIAMIPPALKSSKYTKDRHLELMAMLYDILQKARKEGLMAIEKDIENPHEPPISQKYLVVGGDHHVVEFTTDYLRMMVSGNLNTHRRAGQPWRPAKSACAAWPTTWAKLPPSIQVDDLIQVSLIGLSEALTRYEANQGVQFETFATQRIRGGMIDEPREND